MRKLMIAHAVVFVVAVGVAPIAQKGGEEETGPYDVASNWPQPFARQGYVQGSQGGLWRIHEVGIL